MIGAIIGDVVGSIYEFNNIKTKNFPLIQNRSTFTDDSVLTIAIMDWFLNEQDKNVETIKAYLTKWAKLHPNVSYGNRFYNWVKSQNQYPYFSFGNGSAMRVSAVGYVAKDIEEVKILSDIVTSITHNHEEGLKGAFVTAALIYMANNNMSKDQMRLFASQYYDFDFTYDELVKKYDFNVSCQGTVPQAIYCFLISTDFVDCLRTSISIGGDSDTLAAISCAIAEAYYKNIPEELVKKVKDKLTPDMLSVINEFKDKYGGQ